MDDELGFSSCRSVSTPATRRTPSIISAGSHKGGHPLLCFLSVFKPDVTQLLDVGEL